MGHRVHAGGANSSIHLHVPRLTPTTSSPRLLLRLSITSPTSAPWTSPAQKLKLEELTRLEAGVCGGRVGVSVSWVLVCGMNQRGPRGCRASEIPPHFLLIGGCCSPGAPPDPQLPSPRLDPERASLHPAPWAGRHVPTAGPALPRPGAVVEPAATSPIVYKSTRAGRIRAPAAGGARRVCLAGSSVCVGPGPGFGLGPRPGSGLRATPGSAAAAGSLALRVPGLGTMPCRREEEEDAGDEAEEEEEEDGDGDSFLLLQQSVTLGGSGDVDRLVARIGETLQLDAAAHDRPEPPRAPPADKARPPALPWLPPPPALAPAPARARDPAAFGAWRCALGERGRVRGRTAPYFVAEQLPASGPGALSTLPSPPCFEEGPPGADPRAVPQPLSGPCRRGWLRGAAASRRLQLRRGAPAEARSAEDDPHRLLQQLVLSGNLIKEAVRRLHSKRLRFHAKLPPRPHLGPTLEPRAEPCSPYGHPDAPGRRVQFKTGDGVLVPGS